MRWAEPEIKRQKDELSGSKIYAAYAQVKGPQAAWQGISAFYVNVGDVGTERVNC